MKTMAFFLCSAFLLSLIVFAQAKDIYEAAREGDLETIQAIVSTNTNVVDAQDAGGNTPLLWAVKWNQTSGRISYLEGGRYIHY